MRAWFRDLVKQGNLLLFFAAVLSVAAAIFFSAVAIQRQLALQIALPGYGSEVYSLVPSAISQSAAVRVNLPPGMDAATAKKAINFTPAIQGHWLAETSAASFLPIVSAQAATESTVIYFKPADKLALNRYYKVSLALADSTAMTGDFEAVVDPQILAVFPAKDSETNENTNITIVFNRPMVALTTLAELESKDVPVSITPATAGRFKWITTRNLQFQPADHLVRSSHYTVKVNSGLNSIDGLAVAGAEVHFTTRPLRFVDISRGSVVYNEPIRIVFNQPVDLNRTRPEISVENTRDNSAVPFIAQYHKRTPDELKHLGASAAKPHGLLASVGLAAAADPMAALDQSIIEVYGQADKFGRAMFWDFDQVYTLTLQKTFPAEGDIVLGETHQTSVTVPNIIQSVTAESDRSPLVSPDFFDPQGKLWVSFYEPINVSQSKIFAPKLKDMGYGEKCADTHIEPGPNIDCPKTQDRTKVYFTFNASQFDLRETNTINFQSVVNDQGLQINHDPVPVSFTAFPAFTILKTSPSDGATAADVTKLTICSTTPIAVPDKKDYPAWLAANLSYDIRYWANPWRVDLNQSPPDFCPDDSFHTDVTYGLIPTSAYQVQLRLTDDFGQTAQGQSAFTTGPVPSNEMSFFALQQDYSVTPASAAKLNYAVRNVTTVTLDICKLAPTTFLEFLDYSRYVHDGPHPLPGKCLAHVSDQLNLSTKYWVNNYFSVDIAKYFPDTVGNYVLSFTSPGYIKQHYNGWQTYAAREQSYVSVTNLAVAEKRINLANPNYTGIDPAVQARELAGLQSLYWVTDVRTLAPVANASVTLYRRQNSSPAGAGDYSSAVITATTNASGVAFTPAGQEIIAAVITSGHDSAIVFSNESMLNYASSAASAKTMFLYTDKPIYRPGQTVFLKGIYRVGFDGSYEIFQAKPVSLEAFSARGDSFFNEQATVSDFGTFSTKITLAQDAPLGTDRVCADSNQCATFDVQEYVPAAFQVDVKSDKDEYVSKDTAQVNVAAQYYFGVPLASGTVDYTVSSQNYYFDRYAGTGYYAFGSAAYYGYNDMSGGSYRYGDQLLLRGTAALKPDGRAAITLPLDWNQLFKNADPQQSKIIVVDATVKNDQGQSVSGQQSLIVHAGQFYLGLDLEPPFVAANQAFNIGVKSVDDQGKPLSVGNAQLDINRIDWVYAKRQEADGGFSYKWDKKLTSVKHLGFGTNSSGDFSDMERMSQVGEYEIRVTAPDQRGNQVASVTTVYVYGEGSVSVPPSNDTSLDVMAAKTDLNIGDTAQLIIKSPYPKAKALISVERGTVYQYEIRDIAGNLADYTFPIQPNFVPNVYASVLLLSGKPEVKFGSVQFNVNADREKLAIGVTSDKKAYLPGEPVTLSITARDSQGNPASAELSVAVVDLSVLALKGNPKQDPMVFFYNGFPLTVSTASNIKSLLAPVDIPAESGGKGGGGGNADLARKARGEFKETAFWQAAVRTDAAGSAKVTFTLPDNLTTWRAETIGVTKDTKLGVSYAQFLTRKPLMAVPLKPRFIVPGDTFFVGATIFNQGDASQTVTVSLKDTTLALVDGAVQQQMTLAAGESRAAYFHVQAPVAMASGSQSFTLSASAGDLLDTVTQTIPITPDDTYESTATSNSTTGQTAQELVFLPNNVLRDKGGLTVRASATLAVFLSDGLNYLLGYPYGCSEQLASQLSAIATVKQGLNIPNLADKFSLRPVIHDGQTYTLDQLVAKGLASLMNNQYPDGGFPFWPGGPANPYVTLETLDALHSLGTAGYAVNQDSVQRAANYVIAAITDDLRNNRDPGPDMIIRAEYTLSSLHLPTLPDQLLRAKVTGYIADPLVLREQLSNTTLAYLALYITNTSMSMLGSRDVFTTLDNRINIDARGAFIEPRAQHTLWYDFETPIKDTALYLKTIVSRQSDSPETANVIRWLVNSRAKDGAWGSTQNTLQVVAAFTDFLNWQAETKSDFTLTAVANGRNVFTQAFGPQNILDQVQKTLPLSALKVNENNAVAFTKTARDAQANRFYYDMALKYFLPADQLPPRDEGFSVTRAFYNLDDLTNQQPLTSASAGTVVRERLTITVPVQRFNVGIEDYVPAGMEVVNMELSTEQKSLRLNRQPGDYFDYGSYNPSGRQTLQPEYTEMHDDRAFAFVSSLAPGVYDFDFYVRPLIKGTFIHLPATVSELYTPENFGRTSAGYFEVK